MIEIVNDYLDVVPFVTHYDYKLHKSRSNNVVA